MSSQDILKENFKKFREEYDGHIVASIASAGVGGGSGGSNVSPGRGLSKSGDTLNVNENISFGQITLTGGLSCADSLNVNFGKHANITMKSASVNCLNSTLNGQLTLDGGGLNVKNDVVFFDSSQLTFTKGFYVADSAVAEGSTAIDFGTHNRIKMNTDTINAQHVYIDARNSTLKGDIDFIDGNPTFHGDKMSIKDNVSIISGGASSGKASVKGNMYFDGNVSIEGDASVKGNATFKNTTYFDDKVTFGNAVRMASSLGSSKPFDFGDKNSIGASNDTICLTNSTITGTPTFRDGAIGLGLPLDTLPSTVEGMMWLEDV